MGTFQEVLICSTCVSLNSAAKKAKKAKKNKTTASLKQEFGLTERKTTQTPREPLLSGGAGRLRNNTDNTGSCF